MLFRRSLIRHIEPKHEFRSSYAPQIHRQPSSTGSHFTSLPQNLASSPHHHDLPTFLTHARSTSLSPTSTIHVGTTYEYLCALTLRRLGFNLTRTGGRSDRGIDLLGHWTLPSASQVHVLVQCKAHKAKSGPEWIRELEGAVAGAPREWRGEGTVGVFCAKKEATSGVREAVRRTKMGVVWVMLEDLEDGTEEEENVHVIGGVLGRIRQVLWNEKVQSLVGDGVGAGVRYVPTEDGSLEKEVVLMLDGKVWDAQIVGEDEGG